MTSTHRNGLILVLLSIGISMLWGTSIARDINAWADFRAVYAGTRCLLHGHNPYNVSELEREYQSEDGQRPPQDSRFYQAVTLYVNLPTTFVALAPIAALPWGPAHVVWMTLTTVVFILAILLMWSLGARRAPEVSTLLACTLAINCETIFVGGNTAGIVVGLCVIAVWCFLEDRFVWAGVLCLALSLAIKPHDSGLVWLYFVIAGGVLRKRALQSLLITAVIGAAAAIWVSAIAPHWMQDWHANLAAISVPGGINEPGPNSLTGRSPAMVVDLQAAISVFRDDPRFYNPATYIVCGVLLLVWMISTFRSSFSIPRAWLGLAAVAPLTMLVTYHRPWDAKLVMIAIPACCFLWSKGGSIGKCALLVTTAAIVFTGDVVLALLNLIYNNLHLSADRISGRVLTMMLIRPASIALLAMGLFYLWEYVRQTPIQQVDSVEPEPRPEPVRISS